MAEILEIAPTLPALAAAIATWFPELEGRALAVSDSEITPENIPTLPLCMVALLKETPGKANTKKRPIIVEDFIIEFWFPPERYALATGGQSPFWSFYNYSSLRNKLFAYTREWLAPTGERIEWVSTDIEPSQFAVIIAFRFRHEFAYCEPLPADCDDSVLEAFPDGMPFKISAKLTVPASMYCCDDGCDEPTTPACPDAQADHDGKVEPWP